MENKGIIQKTAGLPVPLLPTMVGAVTIANAYFGNFGFAWIRHISTIAAMIVWVFALIKIFVHFSVVKGEYKTTVPSSLYGGFTMLMMAFGAYLLPYAAPLGRGLWFAGIALHAIHILVFTCRNILTNRNWATTVPSWFVTYNGILVSVVVGGGMNKPVITRIIAYYGIGIYVLLLPFMIYRLATKPLNPPLLHTKCILLAPVSLSLVAYLNAEPNVIPALAWVLYIGVLLTFLYFVKLVPKFFGVPFVPGFAGLTFPNAIGVVASFRMSAYLAATGNETLAVVAREIAGIQLYVTTAIIAFVLYHFAKMFVKSYAKKEEVTA